MNQTNLQFKTLLLLLVLVTIAFIWILLPFYGAVFWAVILGIIFAPMQRRLPKIGFNSMTAKDTAEVLLYKLAVIEGDVVDFAALKAAKLVPSTAKRAKIVKKGELSRKLTIKGVLLTAGAKAAVEAAGGTVEE